MIIVRNLAIFSLFAFLIFGPQIQAAELEDKSSDEILLRFKKISASSSFSEDDFIDQLTQNYKLWEKSRFKFHSKARKKVFRKLHQVKKSKINSDFAVIKLEQKLSQDKLNALVAKINSEQFAFSGYQIIAAIPNHFYQTEEISNDPLASYQWHNKSIKPEALWKHTRGKGIVIAVIDTGVDYKHEDLKNNIWQNSDEIPNNGIDDDGNGYIDDNMGWDFVDAAGPNCVSYEDCFTEDNDPMDINSHGTHVAGIIAAEQNNNLGITGIAPEAKIMPLRAGYSTGKAGFLKSSDIIEAIIYAINNDADVINMSFTGFGLDDLQDLLKLADKLGIIAVAAAGNYSSDMKAYPAALDTVIAVGATSDGINRASYSNYGSWVDIVAPGSSIESTMPNNRYGMKTGTSMASPLVAGIVALIKAKNQTKKLSSNQVKDLLLAATIQTKFYQEPNSTISIGAVSADIKFPFEIDLVSVPNQILPSQKAHFKTEASYSTEQNFEYEWSSNIDGFLSNSAEFEISNLSQGLHTISVKAKNQSGLWSEPAYTTINVSNSRNLDSYSLLDRFNALIVKKKKYNHLVAQIAPNLRREVQTYNWISDQDGLLSTKRFLPLNNLRNGYHKISLSVQDLDGTWSEPISKIIEINNSRSRIL